MRQCVRENHDPMNNRIFHVIRHTHLSPQEYKSTHKDSNHGQGWLEEAMKQSAFRMCGPTKEREGHTANESRGQLTGDGRTLYQFKDKTYTITTIYLCESPHIL